MPRDVASWFICHSLPYIPIAFSTQATDCNLSLQAVTNQNVREKVTAFISMNRHGAILGIRFAEFLAMKRQFIIGFPLSR
jgi:hypothetical protein